MTKALSQEVGGLISGLLPSPRHPDFLLSGERESHCCSVKKLRSPGAEVVPKSHWVRKKTKSKYIPVRADYWNGSCLLTMVLVFRQCYFLRQFLKGNISLLAPEAIAVQRPQYLVWSTPNTEDISRISVIDSSSSRSMVLDISKRTKKSFCTERAEKKIIIFLSLVTWCV